MTYLEAIKDGFRLIHRNWQLILIQIVVVIVSSLGFFIIVGIPLTIAFIVFGIDLTQYTDIKEVLNILKGPSEIISKYFGLFLIVAASLFLYLFIIAMLGIFVFAGSIGFIGRSLKDPFLKFRINIFFEEAKRLFLRLLGFTSMIGFIFIIAAFLFGILGGSIASLVSFAQSRDSTLALFLGTFLSLILIIIALILILIILSISLYGIASLSLKNTGPLKSIKEAINYLTKHPHGFWLYALLFLGYFLISFLVVFLSYPFRLLPVIGTILSFPYQLISYAFETYLGLGIISVILTYYYASEIKTEATVPEVSLSQTADIGEDR